MNLEIEAAPGELRELREIRRRHDALCIGLAHWGPSHHYFQSEGFLDRDCALSLFDKLRELGPLLFQTKDGAYYVRIHSTEQPLRVEKRLYALLGRHFDSWCELAVLPDGGGFIIRHAPR